MSQASPETRPLVSIVTSVYNRVDHAPPSLASLLAQSWPNFEIVMVDDGSTDGTGAWLDGLSDPRIRILRQQNQGNGMGLNTAIQAARGELIAIHDFGDICHPDRVAKQAEVLLARPEIGVVSCWLSRRDVVTGDVTYLRHRKTLPFREAILRSAPFSHGEVMYRKALWDAAGRYRREFRYAVDRDLFVRMSRLCDYHVIEEELYEQRLFPGGISSTPDKLILQAYFAELANECGRRVLRGEEDLVARHSHAAAFFLRPSKTVANRIARQGLAPLAAGDREAAGRLIGAGRAEKATPFTMLAMLAFRAIFFSDRSERTLLPLFARLRRRWTRRRAHA
jgi:glycosyltransferase involved in cell wall biosynthesis